MTNKISLKTLKQVLQLVERYQLDEIEFNGIRVKKSKHAKASAAEAVKGQDADPGAYIPGLPRTIEELDAEAAAIAGLV